MSHYSVAVFTRDDGKDVDELLAPYDEKLCVPHYKSREELIENTKREIEEFRDGTYAEYLKDPAAYVERHNNSAAHINYLQNEFPKKLEWGDDEMHADAVKYYAEEDIKEDGSVFERYNPNSKWDWYSVGGRFGDIPVEPGSLVSDLNIDEVDEEDYKEALRFWELYVDGAKPQNDEEQSMVDSVLYRKEYYTTHYNDAEDYAEYRARKITFYAALLPNGEWLEPGQMGWWGISSATGEDMKAWRTKQKEILKKAKDNGWRMTVVDCHI